MSSIEGQAPSPEDWTLDFWLGEDSASPSFDPEDSDNLANILYMEQVVATLVKDQGQGRMEPFLASGWEESDDRKSIAFTLRTGMRFDDGLAIDSKLYVECLNRLLRIYLKKSSPPVFEDLVGFKEFATGKAATVSGIEAVTETGVEQVRFTFVRRPSGLLEFLSMPYYGVYHPADFGADGHWKDKKAIHASGSYRIAERQDWDAGGAIRLERRAEVLSLERKAAPKQVIYQQKTSAQSAVPSTGRPVLFYRKVTRTADIPEGFSLVKNAVGILNAFAISPYRGGPMDQAEFRQSLRDFTYHYTSTHLFPSLASTNAKGFYPTAQARASGSESRVFKTKHAFSILVSRSVLSDELDYLKAMFQTFAPEARVEFIYEDRSDPTWIEKSRSNRHYDIRLARVDAGGDYINWVVRMMFCSRLGVAFPDPEGSICRLTQEYEGDPKADSQSYQTRFQEILDREAFVIPLFHSSLTWLVTKDLDYSSVSLTQTVPRLDLIQRK